MNFGRTSLLKILKNTDGIALFVAILVMAVVMLFIGSSLFLSRIDAKISNNYKLGTQSLEVADAGLLHALTLIESGYDFDTHLTCGTPPCTLLAATTFPPGSDFTYTVTLENDPADINGDGSSTDDNNNVVVLLSTASGPNGTTREIQPYVNRSLVSFSPPGAIYIPASTANFNFPTGGEALSQVSFQVTIRATQIAIPMGGLIAQAPVLPLPLRGWRQLTTRCGRALSLLWAHLGIISCRARTMMTPPPLSLPVWSPHLMSLMLIRLPLISITTLAW